MNRPARIAWIAMVLYCVAWLLPVIKGGCTFTACLPGWEAVKVAAEVKDDSRVLTAVLRSTAWLNLIMIPAVVLLVRRPAARMLGNVAVALGVTALLNAQWFVWMGRDRWDLRVGYYAWVVSFAMLALGFRQLAASQETGKSN